MIMSLWAELQYPVLLLALLLNIWIGTSRMRADKMEIRKYVAGCGGRVLRVRWSPFGRRWFSESDTRIYLARYVDAEGREHEATGKPGKPDEYLSEDLLAS